MADLTITAANVVAGADASKEAGVAGETIAAGKAVYKSSTSGKFMLADSNSATAEARQARGVALNGASLDQPLVIQKHGDLTIGATLTPGATYFLSDTAGGICPDADVGAGEYVCQLGVAKSASVLAVAIAFPNVAR
jgi:hypothetical protein